MRSHYGITLVEVIIVMGMLSVICVSMAELLQTNSQGSRQSTLVASRNSLNSSLIEELDGENPTFSATFGTTTTAPYTSITEAGQSIPYVRKMDTTNSTAMKRLTYIYLYSTTSDAVTAFNQSASYVNEVYDLRIDVGLTSGSFTDSLGNVWASDVAYDTTNKTPGYVTGSAGTTGTAATAILNTTNDTIYQTYRDGTTLNYNFDLSNGRYTVQLLFAELDATINGGANRRLCDATIEGASVMTSYSPFESVGYAKAHIKSFETTLTDGVLNLSLTRSATSNQNCRVSGVIISRRFS